MSRTLSRRDFLKSTAALMAALSLSSWSRLAANTDARARELELPQPSVQEAPSALASGAAMTDIAAGWDGSLWSVDADGVPHLFDPLTQTWQTFGAGFDAVAWLGGTPYAFQGESVLVNGVLESGAGLWSGLPPSFLLQVDGAAAFAGALYLFQSGRCARADMTQPLFTLTSVAGWPQTPAWADGVVDAVGVAEVATTGVDAPAILLFRSGEYVTFDPVAKSVGAPQPISALVTDPALLAVVNAGFSGLRIAAGAGGADFTVVQDAAVWSLPAGGALTSTYANALAPTRLPRLVRAPEGRLGALWGVTADAQVYTHDGAQWSPIVTPSELSGSTVSLSVGADGTVVAAQTGIGPGALIYQYDVATAAWALLDTLAFYWQSPVAQVAVGNAEQIWLRNADQTVWQVTPGEQYPQANLGVGATHVTANADGTLWHVDGQSASVYRYISEAQSPSQAIGSGAATVTRVASIGFGEAYLLTSANETVTLYNYTSPYVFKTSALFPGGTTPNPLLSRLVAGAGMLFMVLRGDAPATVAIDSKNGAQLWSEAYHAETLVYDAGHQLLYVPAIDGTLYALDATSGATVWTFAYAGTVSGQPVLVGSNLYLATDAMLYTFNVDTALAQASANTPISALWSVALVPFGNPDERRTAAFVTSNHVYVMQLETPLSEAGAVKLTALDGPTGSVLWATQVTVTAQGSGQPLSLELTSAMATLGRATFAGDAQPEPTLLLLAGDALVAIRLADQGQTTNYVALNNGFNMFARFAQVQDVIYAGDFAGNLYAFDTGLNPLPNTPVPAGSGNMTSGPAAMIDADGNALIVFALSGSQSLFAYSPAAGNVTELPTNHATPADMVIDNHGIALVATNSDWDADNGQLFGIRLDTALQADLAFVIESELMQDFDAPTNASLTATARYQTHVTVVDGQKRPLPFQSVHVYANEQTALTIEGSTFTVDATNYAAVQTDAAGALVIVSDATDTYTTPLKLWAPFMDATERIVVYPDREFHNRLTTTTYDSGAQGNPDPTTVNLATASTYTVTNLASPPPLLFTSSDASGAQSAATAIQTMVKSVQASSSTLAARAANGTPGATQYLAYDDLAGAAYAPVNGPVTRPVAPLAPMGFSFDGTYTPLAVADAADAIDALTGAAPDDLPSSASIASRDLLGDFFSWLKKAWEAIKKAVKQATASVAKFVISVGKTIYVGLQYVINGVTHVVKQVIHDIEDIAIAVGSFFVALGKDIDKALEALSIIFHLDKVLATAGMIQQMFTTMINGLPGLLASAKTNVDNFFSSAESTISTAFGNIIAELEGGGLQTAAAGALAGMGDLQGMGKTSRDVFTVGPQGSSQTSSHAVPGMWSAHKMRQNYNGGSIRADTEALPGVGAGNLPGLFQAYVTSMQSGSGASKFTAMKSGFHTNVKVSSPKEFFDTALADFLTFVEQLVIDVLQLTKDMVDGIIVNAGEISGFLGATAGADIPVLSAIWEALTGKALTLIELLSFVIAIPVTLIYRVVEGSYPSATVTASGVQADATVWQRVEGISSAINDLFWGIFNAVADAIIIASANLTNGQQLLITIISISLGLQQTFDLVVGDVLAPELWNIFGSIFAFVVLLLNVIPNMPPEIPSFTGLALAPVLLAAYWEAYSNTTPRDVLSLIANVVGTLGTMINPIKFAPQPVAYVAPVADVVSGIATAALTLADTIEGWDEAEVPTALPETVEPVQPQEHRVFLPTASR